MVKLFRSNKYPKDNPLAIYGIEYVISMAPFVDL